MAFVNKYPYTDFHELNLDWFLEQFKEITTQVTTLDATVQEFTEFVTNYFDNLDVESMVQADVDELLANGTIEAMIQPWFNDMVAQQNSHITTLEARMDEFTNLPYGSVSTAADAELVDIRVEFNGVTAANAGDAVREQVTALNEFDAYQGGKADIFQLFGRHVNETVQGIAFAWDAAKKVCTVNGTTGITNPGYTYIWQNSSIQLPFLRPGKVGIRVSSTNPHLWLQFLGYESGTLGSFRGNFYNGVTIVDIPAQVTSCNVRVFAEEGSNTFTNDTISFEVIYGEGHRFDGVNAGSGSYNATSYIEAILKGYGECVLGPGLFQIEELDMPANTLLRGSGNATILRMTAGAQYGIRMTNGCKVENLMIEGNYQDITLGSTVQDHHGILWLGDYTATADKLNQPTDGAISNVTIRRMSGGGITCDDTGPDVGKGLNVTNVYMTNCNAGINIAYDSEFHRFTNVVVTYSYYGCVNNGGNNVFANCGFSNNKVGIICKMVDGSGRSLTNSLHGSAIGCVFNHIDRDNVTLGKGDAVHFESSGAGFTFTGCQFWYSKIYIEDCAGISFSGCQFGLCKDSGGVDHGYYINLVNSSNNNMHEYFINNTFSNQPDITKTNTGTAQIKVHADLSFTRSGVAIVA